MHLTFLPGCRAWSAGVYPVTDLPQTVVQPYRKCILPGDFHPVVLRRVVRCGNLD